MEMRIDLIRTDGGTQSRAELNQATIDEYAADMGIGAKFPAIVVFYDGVDYWLADGFHRIRAAEKLGLIEIGADVRQGTRRDAILFAAGANASHGLRRTNEDKRRSVTTLLNDEEWRRWSNSEIARRCGVSEHLVRDMRRSIFDLGEDTQRHVERNGKTYTVNTVNIGTRDERRIEPPPEKEWAHTELGEPEPSHWTVINQSVQQKEPDARAYIALDEWRTMTPDQRRDALANPGVSKFNFQDTDNIEWAKWSWNPVTGCRHNCSYCYARDIASRFYAQGFEPSFLPSRLNAPRNTPVHPDAAHNIGYKNVFTCSMADLFGRWVPREWIEAVLQSVAANPQWNFLFLTKFPIRLSEFEFPENAWLGTTVDAQARVANAERAFAKVRGGIKWLSCEPLLEPLTFTNLTMFDWVVIGGASKSTQTPEFHPPREWVEHLEHQARRAGCKVYEKTNLLERIREYPNQSDTPAVNVPDEFKMTYLQRDVLTPTDYQREFA